MAGNSKVSWADRFEGVRASFDPVYGICNTGEDHLRKAFALLESLKEVPQELVQALDVVGTSLIRIKDALGDELSLDGMYPRLARAMINPNTREAQTRVWEQLEEITTIAATGRNALQALDGTLRTVVETDPETGATLESKVKALQGIYSLVGSKINLATRCFTGQWAAWRDATSPPRRAQRNSPEESS